MIRQTTRAENSTENSAEDSAENTDPSAMSLVARLFEVLNDQDVRYCHWKSNIDLAQGLAGDIDIDLLVDRSHLPQTQAILAQLGFKQARPRWGANPPSISHYYGLDPQTRQFAHIHLFSRVLTGESFVKSHLLPFDAMLLDDVDYHGALKVAAKPAELVLFTLRMFIKYGSWVDLLRMRNKAASVQRELRWLMDNSDRRMLSGNSVPQALELLQTYCPVIKEPLFMRCMATLNSNAPLLARVRLAQQVRRRLAVYNRHTRLQHVLAYAQFAWAEVQRRLDGKKKNKVLHSGGALIAFVGADATGKSTLVDETSRWLGSVFAVSTIHTGKPPSAWVTAPLNLALALMRRIKGAGSSRSTSAQDGRYAYRGPGSLIVAVRAVALAWDRRRLIRKARRRAAAGELVVCDRYPSRTLGAMDSPRLERAELPEGLVIGLYNRLVRMERRLYTHIPPPDIVLRLRVSLETARQRNRARAGQDDETYLAARHRQSQAWQLPGTPFVYDIDTEQTLTATIGSVKDAIWRSL